MSKITITGNKRYVNYLYTHLQEEHPNTKKRMQKN